MELDHPLTADETRRLAESWKKRYSTEALSEDTPEQGDFSFLSLKVVNKSTNYSID